MYVSPYTVDIGDAGRESIQKMFAWAAKEGYVSSDLKVEFVS